MPLHAVRRVLFPLAFAALTTTSCTRREPEQPCDLPSPPASCPVAVAPGMAVPDGPMAGWAAACAFGSAPLSDVARDAALRALADERRAEALDRGVVTQFGGSHPFGSIRNAERRHAAAIEHLLAAHGQPAPAAPRSAPPPRFGSLADACGAGAEDERQNIAMYDELDKLDLPADERCVFRHLREASVEHHLPAFERCAP